MQLIEWEVAEDGYEEQVLIPKAQRDLATKEGISAGLQPCILAGLKPCATFI